MESLRSQSGQSALEVLIAVALLAMLSTAGFLLITTSFSESAISERRAEAQNVLEEGMEAVRQVRDRDFSLLADGTYGLLLSNGDWTLNGSEDVTDSLYHRSVTIQTVDDHTRDVSVQVTWQAAASREVVLQNETLLTDWRTAILPSSPSCYGYAVSGDWSHPVVLGSADIGAGNQGSDIVVDLPYVFLSGTAASSNKPDLFAFDVSNPAAPVLVGTIDIGSGGINSLAISGTHVYGVSSNDSKELMVIDVSNPASMQLVSTLDLPGTADGLSVIAREDLVAVGRATSANDEIYFYDMTNPAIPSLVATHAVSGNVNDFASHEGYLYVVSSGTNDDLTVYDVTDPIHPVLAATLDMKSGTDDISVSYNDPGILFIGNAANLFTTVDVTDPLHPVEGSTYATSGQVKDMVCVTGSLLFVGTDNSNKEFLALDISNLNAIAELSSLNFPQVLNGIDFADNKVFAAVRSNDALRIITSSP